LIEAAERLPIMYPTVKVMGLLENGRSREL
jgi:hypothetical protein